MTPRQEWIGDVASAIVIAAATIVIAGSCLGCGGASAEVRTAYAVEQARCLTNERAIVDMPCGDLDGDACETRDREAMAAERLRCDAALRAIYGGP